MFTHFRAFGSWWSCQGVGWSAFYFLIQTWESQALDRAFHTALNLGLRFLFFLDFFKPGLQTSFNHLVINVSKGVCFCGNSNGNIKQLPSLLTNVTIRPTSGVVIIIIVLQKNSPLAYSSLVYSLANDSSRTNVWTQVIINFITQWLWKAVALSRVLKSHHWCFSYQHLLEF